MEVLYLGEFYYNNIACYYVFMYMSFFDLLQLVDINIMWPQAFTDINLHTCMLTLFTIIYPIALVALTM
jgi:hypothetical protein